MEARLDDPKFAYSSVLSNAIAQDNKIHLHLLDQEINLTSDKIVAQCTHSTLTITGGNDPK